MATIRFNDADEFVLPQTLQRKTEAIGLRPGVDAEIVVVEGLAFIKPVGSPPSDSNEMLQFVRDFYAKHEAVFKALAQ